MLTARPRRRGRRRRWRSSSPTGGCGRGRSGGAGAAASRAGAGDAVLGGRVSCRPRGRGRSSGAVSRRRARARSRSRRRPRPAPRRSRRGAGRKSQHCGAAAVVVGEADAASLGPPAAALAGAVGEAPEDAAAGKILFGAEGVRRRGEVQGAAVGRRLERLGRHGSSAAAAPAARRTRAARRRWRRVAAGRGSQRRRRARRGAVLAAGRIETGNGDGRVRGGEGAGAWRRSGGWRPRGGCRRGSTSPRSPSSRRATRRTATWRPTRRWCWRGRRGWRRATSPRRWRRSWRATPGIVSAEVAGPGFLNLRLDPARWFGVVPAVLAAGTGFGRSELGRRAAGQRRVRLGQPDRADARRPYARGGVRRRAGRAARLRRLGGDAGVLHQRRRRAGRRAGAVGLRAVPRGLRAGAGDRRGALSGRLPDPGRRGAEGEVRRRACSTSRRRSGWPRCASSPPRR